MSDFEQQHIQLEIGMTYPAQSITSELMQGWSQRIPPPRIQGGCVLYLDFDGVLHSHSVFVSRKQGIHFGLEALMHSRQTGHVHYLFEHAKLLESLLEPYPHVRIVLSTTWAQSGYTQARSRLTKSLQTRCIGATFHRAMNQQLFRQAPRGLQVYADVCRRVPDRWIALDDDYFNWPSWTLDLFVRTDPDLGISEPHVLAKLQAKLREQFG